MKCPVCSSIESKVIDSRSVDDDTSIRRRRECLQCSNRFTTYERIGEKPLIVVKSDGSSELYNRDKFTRGITIACAKRSISPEKITSLIEGIEGELQNKQIQEIKSKDLGNMALERLAKFDDVAYIRFASVYKDFQNAKEFAVALEGLK